jgi:hypothetical protein
MFSLPLLSQSDQWSNLSLEEQEIMRVVIQVFDGMRAGDSAAVKQHFYPQVSSYSAFTTQAGEQVLKEGDIDQWYSAMAESHEAIWDERIWDYQVFIDGNLSAVWSKYAFYLATEFHHCGANAIQLAHDGERWRIFHIAGTRQRAECEVPKHISDGATY